MYTEMAKNLLLAEGIEHTPQGCCSGEIYPAERGGAGCCGGLLYGIDEKNTPSHRLFRRIARGGEIYRLLGCGSDFEQVCHRIIAVNVGDSLSKQRSNAHGIDMIAICHRHGV